MRTRLPLPRGWNRRVKAATSGTPTRPGRPCRSKSSTRWNNGHFTAHVDHYTCLRLGYPGNPPWHGGAILVIGGPELPGQSSLFVEHHKKVSSEKRRSRVEQ